jgi:hypothetical protein
MKTLGIIMATVAGLVLSVAAGLWLTGQSHVMRMLDETDRVVIWEKKGVPLTVVATYSPTSHIEGQFFELMNTELGKTGWVGSSIRPAGQPCMISIAPTENPPVVGVVVAGSEGCPFSFYTEPLRDVLRRIDAVPTTSESTEPPDLKGLI